MKLKIAYRPNAEAASSKLNLFHNREEIGFIAALWPTSSTAC
jgi:hypothetical protein